MLFNQGDFRQPAISIDGEKFIDLVACNIESGGIEISDFGNASYGRIFGMDFAVAALENPSQDAAVLAITGPEELAILILAKPIHVKNFGELRSGRLLSDLKPVREVVAHVIPAKWKHGHGIAAQAADLSDAGGSCF